jgi:diketogulonate reductase-like aldo/keto reductase
MRLFYGTAWKEDETTRLVRMALDAGFTAIDTANQRKHYFEASVGEALKGFFATSGKQRADLFLQTKFTHRGGQDHRLPYDERADVATQVRQSFESSLEHLGTDYLDSYVLHGPSLRVGLAAADLEAWAAMEALHAAGKTKVLGVSNVSVEQLQLLWRKAAVKPELVQNRCYASRGWDSEVRGFCRQHGLAYQGFSLLTANREVLGHPKVQAIAARLGKTVPQVIFRFATSVGMTPLTGTTSPQHMREDLESEGLALSPEDIDVIADAAA